MAERAYETPQHFFEHVVIPNESAFRDDPKSLRAAFNAVMSTDALAGHLYIAHRRNELKTLANDGKFRQALADQNESFLLIRDTANALKHIELTRHSPVITRVEQASLRSRPFGVGAFGVGSYAADEVMIKLNGGKLKHCLSEVQQANEFLSLEIRKCP